MTTEQREKALRDTLLDGVIEHLAQTTGRVFDPTELPVTLSIIHTFSAFLVRREDELQARAQALFPARVWGWKCPHGVDCYKLANGSTVTCGECPGMVGAR